MSNLSLNEKEFLRNSLKSKLRLDGRGLLDHRNISISFGLTLGSVELSLGDTKIQSKIIYSLEEPRKERPNEGFLKFKVDLSILNHTNQANSIYDTEKYSNEISKLLEKIIKGSK
jgi:exosome complex component RRP45